MPEYNQSSYLQQKFDNLIHYYLVESRIEKEATQEGELENAHKNYWANSEDYFDQFAHLIEESYIPAYQDVVTDLIPLLKEKNIERVNEFGTGDGQWLNYLTQQWPFISRYTGIDISSHQIKKNQKIFPNITFEAADLVDWAQSNVTPHALYHTNGGVLEYLSEASVRKLLTLIKEKAPSSVLFFNEPIYEDYDYKVDTDSRIVGSEFTYNHNYVHLFKELGIEMVRCEETKCLWLPCRPCDRNDLDSSLTAVQTHVAESPNGHPRSAQNYIPVGCLRNSLLTHWATR